ncbi:hydroxyethylthiazole kinase [Chondromyces crocatus]|uniref:Hydroxyethylthiazole kinase n=1 Tax=Chondromyces crocatus TaxID=52 RepID=A0A0K1EA32_CHOCO|nr:hydroxyethylthiazole kinase [Chondromyces crocatus]AKT37443.1 hydroxyethylthiazole kinase [Chondromyces crocatus]
MSQIAELSNTLSELRTRAPLVHNITNFVVMNSTANALLAIGASPAMAHACEEVEELASLAQALVINLGTLSPPWIVGMRLAAAQARSLGVPWVLDPVGAGATSLRTGTARALLGLRPTVLRGNASEILALVAENEATTRGVDSTEASSSALETAAALSRAHGCVVTVSGAVDYVTDGEQVIEVANGHPMMTRVTGLGCTASALIGAFLAVQPDPLRAAAQAMAVLGIAGEIAAERSEGPGSLQMHLLDVLYRLDEPALSRLRMTSWRLQTPG